MVGTARYTINYAMAFALFKKPRHKVRIPIFPTPNPRVSHIYRFLPAPGIGAHRLAHQSAVIVDPAESPFARTVVANFRIPPLCFCTRGL